MMGGGGCASKEMQSSQTIVMEIRDSWQILQPLKVNCVFLAKFPIKKKIFLLCDLLAMNEFCILAKICTKRKVGPCWL
jgi:hypothetical protein